MSVKAIRAGVIGVGALGQHHARIYAELPEVRLVGVCDSDAARAREVAARHATQAFAEAEALLAQCDAVSVAVPTVGHFCAAKQALSNGKDVLVEKPMTTTLAEADELIGLAAKQGAVLQVGHVERFNPAAQVLLREVRRPRFVEVHRLGAFPARSLDIDVVLDVMIHDLDIILALDGTHIEAVDAVGVPVLTDRTDIANARLRFASGLIANVTASRVSTEKLESSACSLTAATSRPTSQVARRASIAWVRLPTGGQPSERSGWQLRKRSRCVANLRHSCKVFELAWRRSLAARRGAGHWPLRTPSWSALARHKCRVRPGAISGGRGALPSSHW